MDWQQKAEALAGLSELTIKFRERQWRIGNRHPWYVSQNIEIKESHTLLGAHGDGATPQEAIEDHWRQYVDDLKPEYSIRVQQSEFIRYVRWSGFMWVDVAPHRLVAPPEMLTSQQPSEG